MRAGDPDRAKPRHSADCSMQFTGADSLSGPLSLMLRRGDESGETCSLWVQVWGGRAALQDISQHVASQRLAQAQVRVSQPSAHSGIFKGNIIPGEQGPEAELVGGQGEGTRCGEGVSLDQGQV